MVILYSDPTFAQACGTIGSSSDVTLRGPISDYHFFGIPFLLEVLTAEIGARDSWQFPLLDYAFPVARMEDILQKSIASPPDYARCAEPVATHSIR
jgi:hypothetical protein